MLAVRVEPCRLAAARFPRRICKLAVDNDLSRRMAAILAPFAHAVASGYARRFRLKHETQAWHVRLRVVELRGSCVCLRNRKNTARFRSRLQLVCRATLKASGCGLDTPEKIVPWSTSGVKSGLSAVELPTKRKLMIAVNRGTCGKN